MWLVGGRYGKIVQKMGESASRSIDSGNKAWYNFFTFLKYHIPLAFI